MLVLSRKAGELIVLGTDIELKVLEIRRGRVRIGILAPPTLQIARGELKVYSNPSQTMGIHKSFQHILPRSKIMPRLNQLSPNEAAGKVKDLFKGIHRKLGMVPHMMRVMGNSPLALDGYLKLSDTLSSGALSAKDRERIALTVAQANGCDYCLAAHSALGKMAGLAPDEIQASRHATASDMRTAAMLQFARAVVNTRGSVTDSELAKARDQGLSDSDIAEVVANVALNVFTNYFNNVAQTDIDFPIAKSLSA